MTGRKNHVVPTSWQDEALARDGVSREVPCSALKGETVPDRPDAKPELLEETRREGPLPRHPGTGRSSREAVGHTGAAARENPPSSRDWGLLFLPDLESNLWSFLQTSQEALLPLGAGKAGNPFQTTQGPGHTLR